MRATTREGGQPPPIDRETPSSDAGLEPVHVPMPKPTAIGAGPVHSCALFDTGAIKCWGRNELGELGVGDTEARGDDPDELGDALPAVNLGSGRRATSVAVGSAMSCALLVDGAVKCWGSGFLGALGLGDDMHRGASSSQLGDALPEVDLGPGAIAVRLWQGFRTCAFLDNGALKCWGGNQYGQLGLGDTLSRGDEPGEMGDALPPIDLGTDRTLVDLALGTSHGCALLENGTVKCWGNSFTGQLGLGDTDTRGDGPGEMGDALPAVDLGANARAEGVAAGQRHSCALLEGGAVKCWGLNGSGMLGVAAGADRLGDEPGEMGDALPVVDLGTDVRAMRIVAGTQHTCALLEDGRVKCWGDNQHGQLGLGDTNVRGDEPGEMGDALPIVDLGTGRTALQLTTSGNHTCALLDNDQVKCWGDNQYGQLGLGDTNARGDQPGEMGDALPAVNL